MAAKTITMLQIRLIIQLMHNGVSKRSIARQCGISRNTLKDYLPIIEQSGIGYAELLALTDEQLNTLIHEPSELGKAPDVRYEKFKETIPELSKELKRVGVTKQQLWIEYKIANPDGYAYSQFCKHMNDHQQKQDTVMHFIHQPGEKMLIDFAGKTMVYHPDSETVITCQVFIAILPFSGYTYIEAVHTQKQECFVRCLENALLYFNGVPSCIVPDNLKACVKRSDRYEPELTELMQQFMLHYNTTIMPARAYKPRDKGAVEKSVELAYQRVYAPLRNHSFNSLEQLNEAIIEQLEHHHQRRFRQGENTRKQLFEEHEKSLLHELPCSRMDIQYSVEAKVQKNYHIVLGQDWHYYSVPFNYVGKTVKIIYTHRTVEIYHQHQRIAFHVRNVIKYGYTTLKEHMPANHRAYFEFKGWNADYFRKEAEKLAPEIAQIIDRVLESRLFHEQTYNSCLGILRLANKYSTERLTIACRMALKANVGTYRFLNNVLKNNMDKNYKEETTMQMELPFHENVRGSQAYQ